MTETEWEADVAEVSTLHHYAAMKIKVMTDYECAPLWWDEAERTGDIKPEDLGLSLHLCTELWAWAGTYDATMDRNDPRLSGFASASDEYAFEEQGRLLASAVASELPEWSVRYWRDA
ncbi:hypothetical protein [Novosphingobium colocasiae]|uniref:hypothetical protein n=1 Tax=Novosphingobium colocasiae TaxID=1256513 RepID=UPI0035B029BB